MDEKTQSRSENAHHVIMNYNGKTYYVNMVRVRLREGKEKHQATFHAKERQDEPSQDLDIEIPQKVYEILLEYAKLDNPDLILVLQVEGDRFKWGFASESWLRQYSSCENPSKYVV